MMKVYMSKEIVFDIERVDYDIEERVRVFGK